MLTTLLLATLAAPDTLPGEALFRTAFAAAYQFAAREDPVIGRSEHIAVVTDGLSAKAAAAGFRSDSTAKWSNLHTAVGPKGTPLGATISCSAPWACPSIQIRRVTRATNSGAWEASVFISYCPKGSASLTAAERARQCRGQEVRMTIRSKEGVLTAEQVRWGGAT